MAAPYYAFFDVDGTLIRIKSMFSFQRFYYERAFRRDGTVRYLAFAGCLAALERSGRDRSVINARFYESFKGRRVAEVRDCAVEWYDHVRRTVPQLFCGETLSELFHHAARGAGIVFVSGSSRDILASLATDVGAQDILATNLEVVRGRYTGQILPPQTIGQGKAKVIATFLQDRGIDPSDCYAYGDHVSDLPMLTTVGNPIVVGADPELVIRARSSGWRVLPAA